MFKKIFIIYMSSIIIFSFLVTFADDEIDDTDLNDTDNIIETVSNVENELKINSRYAVVIDRNTNTILYGKNELQKTKMASTTKIMTAIIVLENANLNDMVEISAKAAGTGGSRLKINKSDIISVHDLLYGLLLRSGNDAAVALAEYVGGNIQGFAKLMNNKAKQLGLLNTSFETPHGLDSDNHYTTAYELALLTNYALNNKTFFEIVGTKTYTIKINNTTRTISNTNELLGNLNGVYGVKTGFTNGAGRCLVTATKRNNLDIICVVLGADTKKIRTSDSIKLIEYTFSNYTLYNLEEKIKEEFENWNNINCNRIYIEKGVTNNISLKLDNYSLKYYPIKHSYEDKINIQISSLSTLVSPILENSCIGKLYVYYDNNLIQEINILVENSVYKKNIINYISDFIINYSIYLENIVQ